MVGFVVLGGILLRVTSGCGDTIKYPFTPSTKPAPGSLHRHAPTVANLESDDSDAIDNLPCRTQSPAWCQLQAYMDLHVPLAAPGPQQILRV